MMNATDQRAELVRQWRDLWQRIEVSHGEELAGLLRELQRIEADAMRLIVAEQEGSETAAVSDTEGAA